MRMNMTMSMRFSKNLRRGLHATPHRRSTECARRTAVSPRQGALAGRFRLIEKTYLRDILLRPSRARGTVHGATLFISLKVYT
jgi:hypothetical protein